MNEHINKQSNGMTLSVPQRLLLLAENELTLCHAAAVFAAWYFAPWAWYWRAAFAAGVLYVLPPFLARVLLACRPFHETKIRFGSVSFFVWWLLFNLQGLFNRFPFLEELLRVVPGLYSLWLRLWGAKIGGLTYWAGGLRILDRSFLRVGDRVVFGAGVRLNAHVLAKSAAGGQELLLAPVVIGDGAVIGGYSLLTAGTEIAAGECTRAYLISPPFSRWENGARR
jgi:hypothetical protein